MDVISIIVPIYNVQNYLAKCIQSIINQSYKNLEIILVDDGSTDDSGMQCDEWEKNDSRIKVFHKENGGVSSARNYGLNVASGTFVSFIDADDWIEPNYCEKLISKASIEPDLVVLDFARIYQNKKIFSDLLIDKVYSLSELKKNFKLPYEKGLINAPWGKLYNRKLIGNLRFDEAVEIGEDLLFNLEYLGQCNKIVFLSDALYNYNLMNESSATHKYKNGYFEQVVKIYSRTKMFKYDSKCSEFYDEIDKRLCVSVINFLQSVCYFSSFQYKKNIVNNWLKCKELKYVCYGKFNLPLNQKIVQWLCRRCSVIGLILFFKIKKLVSFIIKK